MGQDHGFEMKALLAALALLIGISDYAPSGLASLPGARTDLILMQEALKTRLRFEPNEIRVLLDRDATHTGIERAFAALAAAVQPGDFVYVHYSGHGSLAKDFNDNERSGWDQTLVGYGARGAASAGLDRYDILDDEVNRWLAPIAEKAGELVFVADACDSASNTRGEAAPVSRAASAGIQESHPHAHDPGKRYPLTGAVRIGAARDDQSAREYNPQDGGQAGLFTWHWAHALAQAEPTDTWRRLFRRAALRVSFTAGDSQEPQITGEAADRQVLGGRLDQRPALLVKEADGRRVTLSAGKLAG